MGIREWTNKHKGVSYSVVSCCVLAGLGSLVATVLGNRHTIHVGIPDDYFSDDDGETFFVDGAQNVPPFDHQGKTAVAASVFECDGHKFVGYLQRYKPDARKLELAGKASPMTEIYGRELKRPKDKSWVSSGDMRAIAKVVNVTPPAGLHGDVEPVEP